MSPLIKIAALALSVAAGSMAVAGPAAAKACTNGICVEGTDDGRTVNVYPSTKLRPYTHYNVRRNGQQVEVGIGGSFNFRAKPGYDQYYSIQVCNRTGDFGTRSSCTGWVRFYHTTPRRS
jgi:hypothetical protein